MEDTNIENIKNIEANVARFSANAHAYNRRRPQPPAVLVDILTQLAGVETPALVVDLGAGTGLATRIWAGRAQQVIGIEPNDAMRREAESLTGAPNIEYRRGFGHDTGLPDAGADIVTVSQALHWMPPEATFAEVGRILRPGGVFAAIDNDWPPTIHWEVERAYCACTRRMRQIMKVHGLEFKTRGEDKAGHLSRIEASGQFRYVKEILVHKVETGGVERLVGLVMQSQAAGLIERRVTEDEMGLTELRAVAARVMGDGVVPWHFSYRVRLGVK
ncbi:MAG: class I SAM-dependent methyltransferase [Anaerolineae bacterium]|nr:class I SAM-dependent methyltransferase [Anaerolineae bacterium]